MSRPPACWAAVAALVCVALLATSCVDDPREGARPQGARGPASSSTATVEATADNATELTDEQLIGAVRGAVVRVRQTSCRSVAVGSGFLFDADTFVTNRHVVDGGGLIELLSWDGRDIKVRSARTSVTADLAYLEATPPPGFASIPLRASRLSPGERVAVIGFPEGGPLAVSTGVVDGYEHGLAGDSPEVLKATVVVKHGNSGGPVLDMTGRLVGVIFAEKIRTDEALIIPIEQALRSSSGALAPIDPPC